jgi:preprotein translocase subunit SecA
LPRDVWMLITEKHSILEDNLGYGDDEEWEDESDHEPWHRSFSPGVTDERFLHPDAGWLPAGQPPSDHAWPAGQPPSDHAWPAASEGKVGRNDPCPCGSGKKYKKCCGAR